jgi:lysophospholipase L1-like esterase
MPLGDSITDGLNVLGGYRTDLWQLMAADEISADFVGSLSSGPARLPDKAHEGRSGWEIGQIDALVQGWLATYRPEVILLHIGTNDLLHNDQRQAPARFAALLDHIISADPEARVLVATVIPFRRPLMEARALSYNAAISRIVRARAAAGARVQLVDMHSALTTSDLGPDGVHPTPGGYSKMSSQWYAALRTTTTTRWEAEDPRNVTIDSGRVVRTPTASGGAKVGFLVMPQSYLEFRVTVPASGTYRLYVRAANGMATACSQRLIVDGRPVRLLRYANLGYDQWTITSATVELTTGGNTVRLAHDVCDAEVDSIDLMPVADIGLANAH